MIKILANDGIHSDGKLLLEEAGYTVETDKIPQEELAGRLNDFDAICVRSATKIRKELIDQCPNLKVIARGGVGLDNIDVEYAREKGMAVYNTPAASSKSVAELTFAHIFTLARGLHTANRKLPQGADFKGLKKQLSKGFELRGRAMGIIGLGRIGIETARIAAALGMRVIPVDIMVDQAEIDIELYEPSDVKLHVKLESVKIADMLPKADIISIHIPFGGGKAVLGAEQINQMKDGVILLNTARGGVIDEDALLAALDSGKVRAAGIDVFMDEPTPRKEILDHPKISVTPHIGASTDEAQARIGMELAEKIINHFSD